MVGGQDLTPYLKKMIHFFKPVNSVTNIIQEFIQNTRNNVMPI
jgi:hypothetical protein